MSERLTAAVDRARRGGRLLAGFVTGGPVHCIVQLSNLCNLSCGFCSFWERPARREHEMTTADIEVLSDKLAEGSSMVVSIEGGEPLLRPDIVDAVRAFRRHHHPILFTNGWRVTPDLARSLWDAGLDTGCPSTIRTPLATTPTAASRAPWTPPSAPSTSCAIRRPSAAARCRS